MTDNILRIVCHPESLVHDLERREIDRATGKVVLVSIVDTARELVEKHGSCVLQFEDIHQTSCAYRDFVDGLPPRMSEAVTIEFMVSASAETALGRLHDAIEEGSYSKAVSASADLRAALKWGEKRPSDESIQRLLMTRRPHMSERLDRTRRAALVALGVHPDDYEMGVLPGPSPRT